MIVHGERPVFFFVERSIPSDLSRANVSASLVAPGDGVSNSLRKERAPERTSRIRPNSMPSVHVFFVEIHPAEPQL